MFGGNFAPSGWATCDGQLMSISGNTALFSILGTTFGGDGVSSFALPDLRGRVAVHQGAGPGLSPYSIGEFAGTENVTLLQGEMPQHTHQIGVSNQAGTAVDPTNSVVAEINTGTTRAPTTTTPAYASSAVTGFMAPEAVTVAGSSQPHGNLQPYLCATFIIALNGLFPSRG